jgi:hypothetical protein
MRRTKNETPLTNPSPNPNHYYEHASAVSISTLDRKIDDLTSGFSPAYSRMLLSLSEENASNVVRYVLAMRTEINPSDNYKKSIIKVLSMFSKYRRNKPLKDLTREDVLAFLDSFRKSASDPMHKWIGTYNTYRIHILRFFKWLYYPDIEPDKRPNPEVVGNIPKLKRKELSIYKPSDLWTAEDDLLFLKYCPLDSLFTKVKSVWIKYIGCRRLSYFDMRF